MMRLLLVFTFITSVYSSCAEAFFCTAFVKPINKTLVEIDKLSDEEGFDLLLMAVRSLYDQKTFEFAATKYEKYEMLKGLEFSEQDIRFAMTIFLKNSYTHVPVEMLTIGRKALETPLFDFLSDSEKTALALSYLHPTESRDYQRAVLVLDGVETNRSLWHQAEIYYMQGMYKESLARLSEIERASGALSSKTRDAINAVNHKMNGGEFANLAEESSFDNTQWGAFQP